MMVGEIGSVRLSAGLLSRISRCKLTYYNLLFAYISFQALRIAAQIVVFMRSVKLLKHALLLLS